MIDQRGEGGVKTLLVLAFGMNPDIIGSVQVKAQL